MYWYVLASEKIGSSVQDFLLHYGLRDVFGRQQSFWFFRRDVDSRDLNSHHKGGVDQIALAITVSHDVG